MTVSCVTCLPFAPPEDEQSMHGLAKYLPSVGLLIGGILVASSMTLGKLAALPAVSCILLVILWLVLSGGIHFDGLMDTADGIFSHRSRDRMLEIMRDSRVGNFGVMAGIVALLLKIAGLISLSAASETYAALLLIPCWARFCEVFAIGFFPYARESGMGKVWHDTMYFPDDLLKAGVVPLAATLFCAFHFGALATCTMVLGTLAAGIGASFYLSSILHGHTGDTYGAVVELAEAGALLVLILI